MHGTLPAFFVWRLVNSIDERNILAIGGLGSGSSVSSFCRPQLLHSKGLSQVFLCGVCSARSVGLVARYRLYYYRSDIGNFCVRLIELRQEFQV